ncbi:hypothetical protein DL96DRAFT_112498 [Flagelloscypha sp. PMI_526]|nr:hypothetical protein DL96DRAFT_112498 [Flagelloscypha sp. PMI_526]
MKFSTTFSILLAAVAIHAVPVPLNDDVAGIALGLWHTDDADCIRVRQTRDSTERRRGWIGAWTMENRSETFTERRRRWLGAWAVEER